MLLQVIYAGRMEYAAALDLQQRLVALRKQKRIGDVLVLLEHTPVLTLGRNAHRGNILATEEELARRGIAIHEINRGGDVTYHGPGQIVGYPILDLRGDFPGKRGPHLGAVAYVRWLEEVLIRTCGEYGVLTERVAGRTGVWTLPGSSIPEKKIAAIGVHISQGITSHGFAWNVTADLRDFSLIVPCGITDRSVTSLELEIDESRYTMPTLEEARHAVARNFGRIFDRQMLWMESVDDLLESEPLVKGERI
ncbi:MAG TPA: lipoyl(octanoyl) transferase LipB [Acidobacteriaceae bacterium]|jgi:lipoyl(octanoyl) transferase|nr:lipoyl(octanoyl) transferase LipB [Acidobacteriaceae bacterium]